MSEFFALSEAASLAIHGMGLLAMGERMSAKEMAETLGVSEAHLAKVFQRLARRGLVTSTRGPGGGFDLARLPEDVSLFDIYSAIEGTLEEVRCLLHKERCPFGSCLFGGLPEKILEEFTAHLKKTTLESVKKGCEERGDLSAMVEGEVCVPLYGNEEI